MKRRHLDLIDTDESANDQRRIDRRHALQLLVAGAALTQTACGTQSTTTSSSGPSTDGGSTAANCDSPAGFDAGDVSSFANGTWSLVSGNTPFVVAQDDQGVFAFSAVCTHQGCTIGAPDATGKSTCPCHGAQYDGNGKVTRGPARQSLEHYAVAVCNGHVYVDSATTVDASTRTPAA